VSGTEKRAGIGAGTADWIGKLEAEIARELGQPVTLSAGGEAPAAGQSLADAIEVPGARIVLTADREGVAGVLTEGRVVEEGQADAETVRELWSGILSSVAERLGGKASPAGRLPEGGAAQPCTLRLGNAVLRLALAVEPERGGRETVAAGPARAESSGAVRPAGNFDLLLEVALDASVRFGSREMDLKELLELGAGDVVELDRHVADPVDLIVGDKIVARGEVVLVNGNFGLRVTEVAEPVRRLESIRCVC
jgi:flagellar motor switch protein FliN/FliY